jgi:hypothetical protein
MAEPKFAPNCRKPNGMIARYSGTTEVRWQSLHRR